MRTVLFPNPQREYSTQMAAPRRRTSLLRSSGVIALIGAIALAALVAPLRAGAVGSTTTPDVATRLKQIKASLTDAKADLGKRQRILDEANAALNQAENELATADLLRLAARVERAQAKRALSRSAAQLKRLRRVVGDEARGMYISGSPTALAALVQQGDAKDLLDQIATLEHLARENNNAISDMVIAQREYATAQVALRKAEEDTRRAQAQIRKKIAEATELRDVRVDAMEAVNDKIAELEGEAAVLRNAQQQAAANQAGQQRGGGKCDLSGTSDAEYWIIMHESGGDPTADNPSSTAFGLGQLLLDLRQRLLGADYDTIDCGKQLWAFRTYVRERYGTAEAAKSFWLSHGWY
jgi:peptidoglycan hydrolase CwlO-like protein